MFICAQLCLSLCDPRGCSPPGSSVHRFPRKGYWSGFPFLPPGDLPDPRIEPASPECAASAGRFLPTQSPGNLVGNREEIKKVCGCHQFQRRDYEYLKSRELSGP